MGIGLKAINRLSNSKMMKSLCKPSVAGAASAIALASTTSKDVVATYYYVTQSMKNKKIPEEKISSNLPFSSSLSPEALEIHGSFTWLGQTQYKLQLKSQEIHSLQLKACFVHTGVYNLGTPRVFAKLSDQVTVFETSQQSSMPALIIINNV